jgi:MinD-like ATPase involved in chromosome partitioning or flagellar assembly
MYNTDMKIGNSIVVYGCRAGVGSSTLAAMTASLLAAKGEKTLLNTSDADQPFDAVSILSSDIIENQMDDLVILENSNGLTTQRLVNYVQSLTDTLGYLRASSRLTRITKNPARTINNIVETACYEYRYVVLDLSASNPSYAGEVLTKCDAIMHVLTQEPKSLAKVKILYNNNDFGQNQLVLPVVMGYVDQFPITDKQISKYLKTDAMTISYDYDVFKAYKNRDIAGFVYKKVNKGNGLLGGFMKKKSELDMSSVEELSGICDLLTKNIASNQMQGGE